MSVIAFDGVCLGDGPATGVGRAFLDGLRAFAASGDEECVLLTPECAELEDLPGVRRVTAPRGRLRRQRQLPGLLRALGADLLHSSVAAVPLRAPCPTIATVHDLPWFHPELGERPSWWRRFATARALRSAARVLAPSTMTMRDARRLLGRDGDRVALVPHGALEATTTPEEQRDGPLLVLGDDRPRKNRARGAAPHARRDPRDRPPQRFVGPPADNVAEAEKR
ncbi:MAG: glycosyltransferase, partial [Planctomycetota bacterium]|nr:glycosyltransferase [Planctomycetota bacterium]